MMELNVPRSLVIWMVELSILAFNSCLGNPDAKRLYDDLLQSGRYNKLVRPVANHTRAVEVKFGLKFAQLLNVDEKNEIITTNMWVNQEWVDEGLQWELEEYGGVDMIYVPSSDIWLPDVVLYNNADGDYTVTIMTKAQLTHTGKVFWNPPAIYKSQCDISVEYFPFDIQTCKLIVLPWSYDGYKVDMSHIDKEIYQRDGEEDHPTVDIGINMEDYVQNTEWDIISVPAEKNIRYYPCCDEPYPDITFAITLRRKTLYFTINIIVPCVSINLLTLTGFYVPCDCGEKISICITTLLSLSMFQMLLFDIVPATSVSIPLLGKYIMFTMIVITGSVVCSVVVLNVRYRASVVGEMPQFMKWIFLDKMAALLCIRRPSQEEQDAEIEHQIDWSLAQSDLSSYVNPYKRKFRQRKSIIQETMQRFSEEENIQATLPGYGVSPTFIGFERYEMDGFCEACAQKRKFPPNVQKALEGVGYIAKHHTDENKELRIRDDWIYLAIVVDRFLLWMYVALSFLCTIALLLNAPALYDNRPAITSQKADIESMAQPKSV